MWAAFVKFVVANARPLIIVVILVAGVYVYKIVTAPPPAPVLYCAGPAKRPQAPERVVAPGKFGWRGNWIATVSPVIQDVPAVFVWNEVYNDANAARTDGANTHPVIFRLTGNPNVKIAAIQNTTAQNPQQQGTIAGDGRSAYSCGASIQITLDLPAGAGATGTLWGLEDDRSSEQKADFETAK